MTATNLMLWGGTFLLHSTLLIVLVWVINRAIGERHLALTDWLWKLALIVPLLTATVVVTTPIPLIGFLPQAITPTPRLTINPRPTESIESFGPLAEPSIVEPAPFTSATGDDVVLGLAILWAGGACLALIRLAYRYYRLYGTLHLAPVTDLAIYVTLEQVAARAMIKPPTVAQTQAALSPLLLPSGQLVLPEQALTLQPAIIEGILAHEIAHLSRRDPLWLVGCQMLEAILWFQPLLRGVRRHLMRCADLLCDEWASHQLGSPLPLAQGLATVAGWQVAAVPMVQMASGGGGLQQRVRRILAGGRTPRLSMPHRMGWGAVFMVAFSVLTPLTPLSVDTATPPPARPIDVDPTPTPWPRPNPTVVASARATLAAQPDETVYFNWPVFGEVIESPSVYHMALDITNDEATPIVAAADGRVVAAGWDNTGYGYRVIIEHNGRLETLYAHLNSITVEVGDEVETRDVIGTMGSTGRAGDTMLHFEIRKNGYRENPYNFLP